MDVYEITIKTYPIFNNVPVTKKVKLNNEELIGILIMATALFGYNRDKYFEIRDRALRIINIDKIITASNNIALDGEAAFELEPEKNIPWIDMIYYVAELYGQKVNITKPYTVKVDANISYLVQFDNFNILKGLYIMTLWINQNALEYDYLRYLHFYNKNLDLKSVISNIFT